MSGKPNGSSKKKKKKGKALGVVNAKYLMKNGIPISGVGFAVPSGRLKEECGTFLQ